MQDVFDARAMIQAGLVQSIDDTGQVQTVTVETSSGAIYANVEVIQMWGMSGHAPVDGALALLMAIGGDPANFRAILFNPSYRFGGQDQGEMTIFAPDGTRVSCRAGGIIEIKAGNQINAAAPRVAVTGTAEITLTAPSVIIDAASGATITTPLLTINGEVHIDGGPLKVNGVTVIVP